MSERAEAQYLVGIDLGTTHTAVACVAVAESADAGARRLFEIDQLVAPGEVAALPLLPSCRYHPLAGELADSECQLPWGPALSPLIDQEPVALIGDWARELGARADGRQVVSAKSWLSHTQVDRRAPLLPWAALEGVEKVSPLVASASYLAYVRAAWNHAHPEAPLEHQELVVTVPASFDEEARMLTVEAAQLAGLGEIVLLEEPQAVCYDWFASADAEALNRLADLRLLLVCDVGGGTTDLSLIRIAVAPEDDSGPGDDLNISRVAVGDHLMLGGDNIDLALAHLAETRLQLGRKLSAAQLSQLIQQTRSAKERLLAEQPVESASVTLLGSGARLIGGARSCELQQADIQQIAIEGFLPLTALHEVPSTRRSAVVEFGLPFASDAAISKHLAAFLQEHQTVARAATGCDPQDTALPDGLLLNGGVFRSPLLRQRLQQLLTGWRGDARLTLLDNPRPDQAVAFGAVAYAMARRGTQRRIGGGSARSLFLGLEQAEGQPQQAICLLPRGSEEGDEVRLREHRFLLTLEQPVRISVFSSSGDKQFKPGELVTLDDNYSELPPLIAALRAEDGADRNRQVQVELAANLTAVGTLQVQCISVAAEQQRWQLEFQVRKTAGRQSGSAGAALPEGWPRAVEMLDLIFGSSKRKVDPRQVKSLRNNLEKCLGKREQWDINLLRALFDRLLEGMGQRKRSAVHERVWLNLAGYCLRPGFGDPADDWRIQQVWPLFSVGLHYERETQSWIDWWTFWRRLAGGLSPAQQQQIFHAVDDYIDPANLRSRKLQAEARLMSYDDMLRLLGSLEQLPQETKTQTGQWLLERLQKASESPTAWWALGRIGARVPFHGTAHNVVEAATAEQWLRELLGKDWKKQQAAAFAAVMLGRLSGDRSRDLDDQLLQRVRDRLRDIRAPDSWLALVTGVQDVGEKEARRIFGEALPSGLRLL